MTTVDPRGISREELDEAFDFRRTGGDAAFVGVLRRRGRSLELIQEVLDTITLHSDADGYVNEEFIADFFDSYRATKDRVNRHDEQIAEIFRRINSKVSKKTWVIGAILWFVSVVTLHAFHWPANNMPGTVFQMVFGVAVLCIVLFWATRIRKEERAPSRSNRPVRPAEHSRSARPAPAPRPSSTERGGSVGSPSGINTGGRPGILPRVGNESRDPRYDDYSDIDYGYSDDDYLTGEDNTRSGSVDPDAANPYAHLDPEAGVIGSVPVRPRSAEHSRSARPAPAPRPSSTASGRPADILFSQEED